MGSLDFTEIIAKGFEALVVAVAGGIGAWAARLISRINKSAKDLDAVFPKIRRIEAALNLKGECHGTANRYRTEASDAVLDAASGGEGCNRRSLGDRPEDQANV